MLVVIFHPRSDSVIHVGMFTVAPNSHKITYVLYLVSLPKLMLAIMT